MEYFSTIKKENDIDHFLLINATTWMNFRIIVLNERIQAKESTY